jgi:hypothetical protein
MSVHLILLLIINDFKNFNNLFMEVIMKKGLLIVAALCLSLSVLPYSASATSETTDASIQIVDNISITEISSLEFGRVLNGTTGINQIYVWHNDVRGKGGVGDAVLIKGTTPTAAEYDITSSAGTFIDIEVDSATLVDPHDTIKLNNYFYCVINDGGQKACDTGDGASYTSTGLDNVKVGGRVTISNPSVAGVHVGTFDFVANYQ